MGENLQPNSMNSPSRLPAPKSRKQFFSNDTTSSHDTQPNTSAPSSAQKRRREASPPRAMANNPKPASILTTNHSSIANSSVRTFRSSGTTTSRPPVTRTTSTIKSRLPSREDSSSSKPSLFTEAVVDADLMSKKRAPWDTRGRLEDMETLTEMLKQKVLNSNETHDVLQRQLEVSEQRVRELELFKESLNSRVIAKEQENSQIGGQLNETKLKYEAELNSKELELTKLRAQLQCDVDILTRQRDTLKNELDLANSHLQESKIEASTLRATISRNSVMVVDLESQIKALRMKIDQLEEEGRQKDSNSLSLHNRLVAAENLIRELEDKVQKGETLRRKLHNTVQELKGNIRVFCRVRPLLESEVSGMDDVSHMVLGDKTNDEQEELQMVQITESASGNPATKTFPFAFDKVFGPSSTQNHIFEEISQLVQSALDGYRVCIFAYGQTGSGKTYTMEGGPERHNPNTAGMIPRAVQQIFSSADSLKEKGWSFFFEASYLEIYNENIRDLLLNGSDAHLKYEIKHLNGSTSVTDLNIVRVESPDQVMGLLAKAAHNRAVAETQCNDRSSRSHSVFSLRIVGENSITTEKIEGLLNLIDLAGSERLSQSGSTGDRLKETQAINKSLSSLGDVIYALGSPFLPCLFRANPFAAAIANKESHVPFRNSKLTYLLQNFLGGNCKTLMFVNVSPVKENFQETLCSLRFATKVNSCQIGTARRTASK